MSQPDDRREEFAVDLAGMLETPGWQKVAVTAIRQRLAKALTQLEKGHHNDLSSVLVLQAEVRLLRQMLEPRAFFVVDLKKGTQL